MSCRLAVELSNTGESSDMAENNRKKTSYSFWNSDINERLLTLSAKSVTAPVTSDLGELQTTNSDLQPHTREQCSKNFTEEAWFH